MAMVAPSKGTVHRVSIVLKGPVSQKKYDNYKKAIAKLAKTYGADVTAARKHRGGK